MYVFSLDCIFVIFSAFPFVRWYEGGIPCCFALQLELPTTEKRKTNKQPSAMPKGAEIESTEMVDLKYHCT
jgi:hypothetical protein